MTFDSFVNDIWEAKMVSPVPILPTICTPQNAFAALCEATRGLASDDLNLRPYLRLMQRGEEPLITEDFFSTHAGREENAELYGELLSFLPHPEDESFEQWDKRIEEEDYLIILSDLNRWSAEIDARTRAFLRELFPRVGQSEGEVSLDLLIGRYSQTHFGVHFDRDASFFSQLVGPKDLLFWEPEYIYQRLAEDGRYPDLPSEPGDARSKMLEHARRLHLEAGDTAYWPSWQWHTGEPCGQLTVSTSLSCYRSTSAFAVRDELLEQFPRPHVDMRQPLPGDFISFFMDDLLDEPDMMETLMRKVGAHYVADLERFRNWHRTTSFAVPKTMDGAVEVPAAMAKQVQQIRELSEQVERESMGALINSMSTLGLRYAGPNQRRDASVALDQPLRRVPATHIFWSALSTGELLVGANGSVKSFDAAEASRVIEWLEEITSAGSDSEEARVRPTSPGAPDHEARSRLLAFLVEACCIEPA